MKEKTKKVYLLWFNFVSYVGWNIVLLASVFHVRKRSTSAFWQAVKIPVNVVQFLAILEVVHSALKIVRSPLTTTFMQVLSRLIVLGLCSDLVVECQSHWSLYLMFISWSLAELPRYLFYTVKQYSNNSPWWLTWLRYSCFAVLYPTGISGELIQLWVALDAVDKRIVFVLVICLYAAGSPVMYRHMLKQRRKVLRQMKKRKRTSMRRSKK